MTILHINMPQKTSHFEDFRLIASNLALALLARALRTSRLHPSAPIWPQSSHKIDLTENHCGPQRKTQKHPIHHRGIVSSCCAATSVRLWKKRECPRNRSTRPQQLTVLGCCLQTKSEKKSNSFCPRKSSGSS